MSSKSWKKYQVAELSVGTCGNYCTDEIKSMVMALNGEDCYCGSEYPPKSALVTDSNCNFPCPQYKPEACTSSPAKHVSVTAFADFIDRRWY